MPRSCGHFHRRRWRRSVLEPHVCIVYISSRRSLRRTNGPLHNHDLLDATSVGNAGVLDYGRFESADPVSSNIVELTAEVIRRVVLVRSQLPPCTRSSASPLRLHRDRPTVLADLRNVRQQLRVVPGLYVAPCFGSRADAGSRHRQSDGAGERAEEEELHLASVTSIPASDYRSEQTVTSRYRGVRRGRRQTTKEHGSRESRSVSSYQKQQPRSGSRCFTDDHRTDGSPQRCLTVGLWGDRRRLREPQRAGLPRRRGRRFLLGSSRRSLLPSGEEEDGRRRTEGTCRWPRCLRSPSGQVIGPACDQCRRPAHALRCTSLGD